MKFIQFYPWWDCGNNCAFCFAKLLKQHKTTKEEQISALDYVLKYLQDIPYISNFEVVGLIGGEFFEDQLNDEEVYAKFLMVINQCITLIEQNIIQKLYLMTHLIYPDNRKLTEVINLFKQHNITKKLLLCTSFDPWGRFHTPSHKQLWWDNVTYVQSLGVDVHVEMILSQHLIDAVLSGSLDLLDFIEKDIHIDFLNPQGFVAEDQTSGDTKEETLQHFGAHWLPTRASFIKFLAYLHEYKITNLHDLFTLDKRAQELHFIPQHRVQFRDVETYNENIEEDTILPCGHSDRFSFYTDSDKCMVCDIQNFLQQDD